MESPARDSLPVPTAVLLSILLHAVAVVIFLWASTASGEPQAIAHEVPDDRKDEESPAEPLGIEESNAETLTWIGYQEYAEHLARLSEVEQAAMSAAPRSGGGGSPPASNPSTSTASAAAPAIPLAAQPSAAAPGATVPSPETETPELLIDPEILLEEKVEPTTEPEPVDSKTTEDSSTTETEATPDPTTKPDEQTTTKDETAEDEPDADAAEDEPDSPSEEKPTPEPTPDPAPDPSPEPRPEPAESEGDGENEGEGPGDPEPDPGNDADKDADATSLVRVPASEWKQGKPLAAQGLNIRTRRPSIPLVAWLGYQPRFNPVARIEFDRSGKPKHATLVVRSGEEELDERLTDMLFRWRASGKRLTELTGDQTVTIELQLLLN